MACLLLQYRAKKTAVQAKRIAVQATKRDQQDQKDQRDRVRKEQCTTQIAVFGGIWTLPEDVDNHTEDLDVKKQRKAVETQIRFRRFVLGAKNTNNILSLSSGGRNLPLQTLKDNLRHAIRTAQEEEQELHQDYPVMIQPLANDVLLAEKRRFQELVSREQAKDDVEVNRPKRKKTTNVQRGGVLLEEPEDLVGKRVRHLCEEDGVETWYLGLVTDVDVKAKRSKHPTYVFTLRYVHNIS